MLAGRDAETSADEYTAGPALRALLTGEKPGAAPSLPGDRR
jgi:hypothetical protein